MSRKINKVIGAVCALVLVISISGYVFADGNEGSESLDGQETENTGTVGTFESGSEPDIIYVTGVDLYPTYAYLKVRGESTCLTATVYPLNATNQGLTWTTDNAGVAVVSEEGEVSPVGAGFATITVTTNEGGFTATCEVYVESSVNPGWNQIDGKWYYYSEDLVMATGWQKISGKWYLFDEDGVMLTGWQSEGGKWYYFSSGGAMQTGWQKIGSSWYYFNGGGDMVTGWKKISNKWYYFSGSGSMATGWQKISNKWYYFESSGAMKTGWLKLSGKWYYFESSGVMVTGTKTINGKSYNFNSSGVCLNP